MSLLALPENRGKHEKVIEISTRSKGRRTLNKAKEYYEEKGWLVDEAEKTGRFRKHKDLFSTETFGGFDLVCIRDGVTKLVQVKTNTPAIQGPYKDFARKYAGRYIKIEGITWYDRAGFVVHRFMKNGKIKRIDLRK